jgi:hypothetical protein
LKRRFDATLWRDSLTQRIEATLKCALLLRALLWELCFWEREPLWATHFDTMLWCYALMLCFDARLWCYALMLRFDATLWRDALTQRFDATLCWAKFCATLCVTLCWATLLATLFAFWFA